MGVQVIYAEEQRARQLALCSDAENEQILEPRWKTGIKRRDGKSGK
jgi:hypothetical protein